MTVERAKRLRYTTHTLKKHYREREESIEKVVCTATRQIIIVFGEYNFAALVK